MASEPKAIVMITPGMEAYKRINAAVAKATTDDTKASEAMIFVAK